VIKKAAVEDDRFRSEEGVKPHEGGVTMGDMITLTIPREERYHGIARLVLGGLAARTNLTYEHLEDLELALDGLLERAPGAEELTVALAVEGDSIETIVGPFEASALAELERPAADELGLRRILDTVSDGFNLENRDGSRWVHLHKTVEPAPQR
jgi:hypothetical protein